MFKNKDQKKEMGSVSGRKAVDRSMMEEGWRMERGWWEGRRGQTRPRTRYKFVLNDTEI